MRKMPKDSPICWPALGIAIFAIILGFILSAVPEKDVETKSISRINVSLLACTSFLIAAIYYIGWAIYNKLCDIEEILARKKRKPDPDLCKRLGEMMKEVHDSEEEKKDS